MPWGLDRSSQNRKTVPGPPVSSSRCTPDGVGGLDHRVTLAKLDEEVAVVHADEPCLLRARQDLLVRADVFEEAQQLCRDASMSVYVRPPT